MAASHQEFQTISSFFNTVFIDRKAVLQLVFNQKKKENKRDSGPGGNR